MTLLTFGGGAAAQDTLVSLLPKSNCYYNYWLDSGCTNYRVDLPNGYIGVMKAVYFYTEDRLPVYGIAASLELEYTNALDTSTAHSFEYLGLYKNGPAGLNLISDSLCVHFGKESPSYYFSVDPPDPFTLPQYPYPNEKPVYERFFDTAVVVTDSFYVGITNYTWAHILDTNYFWVNEFGDTIFYADEIPLGPRCRIVGYTQRCPGGDGLSPTCILEIFRRGDSLWYNYWDNNHYGQPQFYYPYVFPILAPPDTATRNPTDTTIVDTTTVDTTTVDTVGIATLRTVERYVNLLPNPASERVQVTSSFGLRGIEVYNAAGVKVQEQRAVGYTATLDISALPEGSYLVRVATPSGTVTKKLVVQRR